MKENKTLKKVAFSGNYTLVSSRACLCFTNRKPV
jgi:hypothetical protein